MQGQERNSEIRPIPDKQCSLVSSETVPVTTGRVIGQAGALPQNVTDSKQAEAALRRLNEELEQMVEARTQELSAANEELTAMNEEIGAINQELQAVNHRLETEIEFRKEKEAELLVRARQYHAASSLLLCSNEASVDRIQSILRDALQLIGAPAGYVGLYDETNNKVIRSHSVGPVDFVCIEPQPADSGVMGQVFVTKEPVVVQDYSIYPGRLDTPQLRRISSLIMVPLRNGTRIKGIIAAHWLDEARPITETQVEVLTQFAVLAAVVLEQIEKQQQAHWLAYHDSLTGLPNRASLAVRLEQELICANRGEAVGVVIFVDLDDLKVVNDHYGHSCGDAVIIQAGKHIFDALGQETFVARIGGDEFVLVIPGEQNFDNVAAMAARLVASLSQDYPVCGEFIRLSASLGVAFYPKDGNTVEDILKNADSALYAAKNTGKNCWRFYDEAFRKESYDRMVLAGSLHRALERQELFLHFQPQVACNRRRIVGFEALLRWASPEHGDVSPVRFIPLAEQSGLIHPIGRYVLQEACRFAACLKNAGYGNLRVAVNISPRQLAAPDFVGSVQQCIAETDIEADQLELEVTENVFIESIDDSIKKLLLLKEIGVFLALDDFGTGYSSLNYLRRLPVHTLKIDKSFIDLLPDDKSQEWFVRIIIEMAHSLNLHVVAEGVEQQQQLVWLERSGCDVIQGYVYSRPAPAEEAIRLLRRTDRDA